MHVQLASVITGPHATQYSSGSMQGFIAQANGELEHACKDFLARWGGGGGGGGAWEVLLLV